MNRIERKSSIEKEPRTLSLDQIKYAREAALCVLRTHSIEEAVRIFTEGLRPVIIVNNGSIEMMGSDEDGEKLDHLLAVAGLKDAVTAPF